MTISATFVEPHFSRPQDAIPNAGAAIFAYFAVNQEPLEALWWAYLTFTSAVLLAALIATIATDESTLKWLANRFSSVFGRAVNLGGLALTLVLVTEAARGRKDLVYFGIAVALLCAALGINWSSFLRRARGSTETGSALAAVGPRMLLATAGANLATGTRVRVQTSASGGSDGCVVARLPHRDGLRYQIALDEDSTVVCSSYPCDVEILSLGDTHALVGVAGAGSSDTTVEFEPFVDLEVGKPLVLPTGTRQHLYQVSRLRLIRSEWAGAASIVPHAVATQIGWPEDGFLRSEPQLPAPHDPIHRPENLTGNLPDDYFRVGTAKGTEIPIGLRFTGATNEHVAVLGMSGTGKTAVVKRVAAHLGTTRPVIALDETGEYRTRLGVTAWNAGDFDTVGFFVNEPRGDAPAQAAAFIRDCMNHANTEYAAGQDPTRRIIVLEEAHSFIPEGYLALRTQLDNIAYSTRMIMQARKFGLTFFIVSQRTAVVSKSALSQCENYVILRTIDETSLTYLETLVGPAMRDAIPGLKRYEAVCIGPNFNSERPVIVSLDAP